MVYCGIWVLCIMGFVQWVYWLTKNLFLVNKSDFFGIKRSWIEKTYTIDMETWFLFTATENAFFNNSGTRLAQRADSGLFDTVIFTISLSYIHLVGLSLKSKLEKSANMASNWFANNHMKSNFSKFQAMILNNHPDSCEISLRVANTDVKLNDCVKLLGVYIDCELKFTNHVDHLCKRTSRQLSAIRRIAK